VAVLLIAFGPQLLTIGQLLELLSKTPNLQLLGIPLDDKKASEQMARKLCLLKVRQLGQTLLHQMYSFFC
jgi:hypothetical protein